MIARRSWLGISSRECRKDSDTRQPVEFETEHYRHNTLPTAADAGRTALH